MSRDNALCAICGKDRQWHVENQSQHEFTLKEGELTPRRHLVPEARGAKIPFDPVLRFALIEKGIITTDDLDNAEKKLRAVGVGEAAVTRSPEKLN